LIGEIGQNISLIDNNSIRGLFKITFLNQIEEHDKLWINITDFENLGWYYDLYIENKKVGICNKCNKLFKQTGKYQLYCKECAIDVQRETNRIWMREHRKNDVEILETK
jgi:hypothetical protein